MTIQILLFLKGNNSKSNIFLKKKLKCVCSSNQYLQTVFLFFEKKNYYITILKINKNYYILETNCKNSPKIFRIIRRKKVSLKKM